MSVVKGHPVKLYPDPFSQAVVLSSLEQRTNNYHVFFTTPSYNNGDGVIGFCFVLNNHSTDFEVT